MQQSTSPTLIKLVLRAALRQEEEEVEVASEEVVVEVDDHVSSLQRRQLKPFPLAS